MSLLAKVSTKAKSMPYRAYFYAREKFGKTSQAAYSRNPIFIMTEGETGLLSLLSAGRIPETAHFPDDCKTWEQLLEYVNAVLREDHTYETLVIDTANGAERLAFQHVLKRDYAGQVSKYGQFGKGDLASSVEWSRFLAMLDECRMRRKMNIILLAHARVKSVSNPEGDDYDQYRPEGIEKLWTLTHKWADVILYGDYELQFTDEKKVRTGDRILRTTGTLSCVAGNRYGLPEIIRCGNSPERGWRLFEQSLEATKNKGHLIREPNNTLWKEIESECLSRKIKFDAFVVRLKAKYGNHITNHKDLTQDQATEVLESFRKNPPNTGKGGDGGTPVNPKPSPSTTSEATTKPSELEKGSLEEGSVPMEPWEDDPIDDAEPAASDNYGVEVSIGTIAQDLLTAGHARNMTWSDIREFARGKLNRVITNETKITHLSGVELASLLQEINKLPLSKKRPVAHA